MKKNRITVFLYFIVFISLSSHSIFSQSSSQHDSLYNVNDLSLFVKTIGEGTPILIVHGGPGMEHSYLLPQLEELAENYQLIFYDQRGTGKSEGDIDSNSITLNNFIEDIEGLRRAIGLEKFNIIGHSWGALLALQYVIRYTENVERMILVSSMSSTSEFLPEFVKNRETRRTSEDSIEIHRIMNSENFALGDKTTIEKFTKLFFKSYFFDQSKIDELNINFTQTTAKNFIPVFTLLSRYFLGYNLKEKLKNITTKILIIHGDFDPIPLKYANELNAIIKNSRIVVLKDCGHFPFIEVEEQFLSECKEFLK